MNELQPTILPQERRLNGYVPKDLIAEIQRGQTLFIQKMIEPPRQEIIKCFKYIHLYKNNSLIRIFASIFLKSDELEHLMPEQKFPVVGPLVKALNDEITKNSAIFKDGCTIYDLQFLSTFARQFIRKQPTIASTLGFLQSVKPFGNYHAYVNKKLLRKYAVADGSRDNFYFFNPENRRDYERYCLSINTFMETETFKIDAPHYYEAMQNSDLGGSATKLSKAYFGQFSFMIGFSAKTGEDPALFILTPFIIQTVPTAAIIKICKKLNYSRDTKSFSMCDENYLVKISDARQDLSLFGKGYKAMMDTSTQRDYTDSCISPTLDQKTQCEIWSTLMMFRRLRGAKTYGSYYYSSRSDLSRKGKYLKKYLFMPMLEGFNLEHASLPAEILRPNINYAALREPLLQSAMDLYVLHEIIGRTHGDLAHGSIFRKRIGIPLYGSNIFVSSKTPGNDGILIDFEVSTPIGQPQYKDIGPFYSKAFGHSRIDGKMANPISDIYAFLNLIEDLFQTDQKPYKPEPKSESESESLESLPAFFPPELRTIYSILDKSHTVDTKSALMFLANDPLNYPKINKFLELIQRAKKEPCVLIL